MESFDSNDSVTKPVESVGYHAFVLRESRTWIVERKGGVRRVES